MTRASRLARPVSFQLQASIPCYLAGPCSHARPQSLAVRPLAPTRRIRNRMARNFFEKIAVALLSGTASPAVPCPAA